MISSISFFQIRFRFTPNSYTGKYSSVIVTRQLSSSTPTVVPKFAFDEDNTYFIQFPKRRWNCSRLVGSPFFEKSTKITLIVVTTQLASYSLYISSILIGVSLQISKAKMADKYDGWHDNWNPKFGNFEVPDPSEYSSIEGIWQLEYTKNYLAKHGLKDPWMRYCLSLIHI